MNKKSANLNDTKKTNLVWKKYETTIIGENIKNISINKSKIAIAGFDLDNTLIKSKSKFPTSRYDWEFVDCVDLNKLRNEAKSKIVVIISNQLNLSGNRKIEFMAKIEDINNIIDIPMIFIAGIAKDKYRKPDVGMWKIVSAIIKKYHNIEIDMKKSYYVGDAAGRPKDFAASDVKFAYNLGIKFYTPEAYFTNAKNKYNLGDFNPSNYISQSQNYDDFPLANSQELLILVGIQGSGKSSLAKYLKLHQNYEIVNRDILLTINKCKIATKNYLQLGKNVVIDNTNPSIKSRAEFINIAKLMDINVRICIIKTSEELAKHMNYFRYRVGDSEKLVPEIAYNIYKKSYEIPTNSEGIDEIIEFAPAIYFLDENKKALFAKYT